ncbi:protein shisa-1-like [Chelonoidis abingdonii]|uniref:Shisa N-terminal domain-containing protein n=1 Tax=Chelonoidis abingdonii TaxID=106734 RepID=A0A8C0GNV9_CHEAB|nr:protein shisa-1-like [Chelonoidis abingdonii]
MERGPLCLLVLLLTRGSTSGQDGEYCHGQDSSQLWHRGFRCPEHYDSPKATLCCGTCNLRYCCSTREARLDQGLCPSDHHQTSPKPPSVPMYLPFLLVGSIFVAFIVIGGFIGICCCRCLKSQDEEQQHGPAPIQSWLLEAAAPPWFSSSSSATRCSLGSHPQTNICLSIAPPFPIIGSSQGAQFLPPTSTNGSLLQPVCTNFGIPMDHTIITTPASFLDRAVYGQTSYYHLPVSAMHGDQTTYSEAHV